MLLPSGNPIHEVVLPSWQPLFPPKRFDEPSPSGRCSEGLDAFIIFFQHDKRPVVVVAVVDSHIQRIVLATEETTVIQQVSQRPIK